MRLHDATRVRLKKDGILIRKTCNFGRRLEWPLTDRNIYCHKIYFGFKSMQAGVKQKQKEQQWLLRLRTHSRKNLAVVIIVSWKTFWNFSYKYKILLSLSAASFHAKRQTSNWLCISTLPVTRSLQPSCHAAGSVVIASQLAGFCRLAATSIGESRPIISSPPVRTERLLERMFYVIKETSWKRNCRLLSLEPDNRNSAVKSSWVDDVKSQQLICKPLFIMESKGAAHISSIVY